MILHPASPRRTGTAALLFGLVLTASLSACGGAVGTSNDNVVSLASPATGPGASAAPTAPVDPDEAMRAFSECMKEHGVDVQVGMATVDGTGVIGGPPSGSFTPGAAEPQAGNPGDLDPKAMQEADEACRHLLPSGMVGDPGATIPPEQVERSLAFAKCMREHGFDMPDPQFSGNSVTVEVGVGPDGQTIDGESEEFQAALEACSSPIEGGAPVSVGGGSSVGGSQP